MGNVIIAQGIFGCLTVGMLISWVVVSKKGEPFRFGKFLSLVLLVSSFLLFLLFCYLLTLLGLSPFNWLRFRGH